ncbi:hypothetical protein [Rhodovulum adriaticum]|uniref:Uncharacterized protein n=1 Tax=Rhodovulum adriaticum TaxID=35804 RepID=A0A4R2NZN3_RHOAD|nr:hypothetical protein [Rhodovulum adriaticum]MBK1634778.1 hypothetical protein [Rhodovulum adriaticum]TCP27647.1 hypothetical protein EV656_101556 [Rhodovulum adriaticum]
MGLIADILLVAGALGAAFYCFVLAGRLRRFNDLEDGMGGAVAALSVQVDEMTQALAGAQNSAEGSTDSLARLTARAEEAAQRLELLVAALHERPAAGGDTPESADATVQFQRHGGDRVA